MKFKPMLAAKVEDQHKLTFPLIASPKLDGIRCLIQSGRAVSRKLLSIPNAHVQKMLRGLPDGLDGELMLRDDHASFSAISSAIMSRDGEPDFVFWVFDCFGEEPYIERFKRVKSIAMKHRKTHPIKFVRSDWVKSLNDLLAYEREALDRGFEGACVRAPDSPYKEGRSTFKQGYLLKLKRFVDAEAELVGFVEQQENTNAKERDNLGNAKRSHAKEGKKPKGTLGAFVVRDPKTGNEFNVGTGSGLTNAKRAEIWAQRHALLVHPRPLIRYRYQEHGTKNAPRLPVWTGFRDHRDA